MVLDVPLPQGLQSEYRGRKWRCSTSVQK